VLNLESDIRDAYTADHLVVAKRFAEQAGAAYVAAHRRKLAAEGLEPCFGEMTQESTKYSNRNCRPLKELFDADELLRDKMNFILWERDFDTGVLAAHHNHGRITRNPFTYSFEEDMALAVSCYIERRRMTVDDAKADILRQPSSLNAEGVREFDILGPVIAQPIRSRGHLAGVLVMWSSSAVVPIDLRLFCLTAERMHRITDVLVNVPDQDIRELTQSDGSKICYPPVDKISGAKNLVNKLLQAASVSKTRRTIAEMLKLLVCTTDIQPFGRVRLWLKCNIPDESQQPSRNSDSWLCVATYSGSEFVQKNSPAEDEFIGCVSDSDDQFGSYTRHRAPTDPYARLQYPQMFGGKGDTNTGSLKKDPKGCWIVGPIVRPKFKILNSVSDDPEFELLGFISVDSHRPIGKEFKDRTEFHDVVKIDKHEQLLRFQRRTVDLVTHLLADLLTDPEQSECKSHLCEELLKKALNARKKGLARKR
ncbi:MAG: GAF domain-containing protein, partial [Prosthecobacter sp.]